MRVGTSFFVIALFLAGFNERVNSEDVLSDDPTTWPGHLEPLASRNVKYEIESVDSYPDPQEFFTDYVVKNKPLLIKEGAKISPAFQLWTDDYFLSLPGADNTTVFVEQNKKENRTFPGYDTTFKDFLTKYNNTEIYMVNGVPDILQKDILLPPPLLCKDVAPMLVDTVMWFSSGGTKSVFHHDDVDNINCLYSGSKTLLFVEYQKYKAKLRLDNAWGGFSGVDIERVDFTKYPIFSEIEFYYVNMDPGDCLFIPYKWYHQVSSFGRNIAVNIWWKHHNTFVPKKCNELKKGSTLDKFYFASLEHQKKDEDENDDDGDGDEAESGLIGHLSNVLKDGKELTFDDFVKFILDSIEMKVKPELDADVLDFAGHIFQSSDFNKDGVVTIDDFTNIDDETFAELENDVAELENILQEYHDPITYEGNTREEL